MKSNLIEMCRESFEKRKDNPEQRRKFLVDAGILKEDGEYVDYFKDDKVEGELIDKC